jgi:hypothetical protein
MTQILVKEITSVQFVALTSLAALLVAAAGGCAPGPVMEVGIRQPLGESWVTTVQYTAGDRSHLFLLNLHENESTSVRAGLELIRRRGGRLLMLRQRGERLIAFELDGRTYAFDPNRIFTDAGTTATLRRYGPEDERSFRMVRRFAEYLLQDYGVSRLGMIITLHNNTDGEYSARDYLPGGALAADAARVHLDPRRDPDDFFFVTDPVWFDRLSARGFNVVLQDNTRVTDDGSLSVLAGRLGIPYINVEAQHGHLKTQRRMLEAIVKSHRFTD